MSKEKPEMRIYAANGGTLECVGQTTIPIEIGGKTFSQKAAVVKDFPFELLLNNDFLNKVEAIINFPKKTLEMKGIAAPIKVERHHQWATVIEERIVPPRSEMILLTRIDKKWRAEDKPLLFELNEELAGKKKILIAKSIISGKEELVLVKICNPTLEEVKIQCDMKLGTLELCNEIRGIEEIETSNLQEKQLPKDLKLDNLSINDKQKEQLKNLLEEYADIFAENPKNPGTTKSVTHEIKTGNNKPINLQPFRTGPKEDEIIAKEVKEMLKNGI